jgi:hypothetical protein
MPDPKVEATSTQHLAAAVDQNRRSFAAAVDQTEASGSKT